MMKCKVVCWFAVAAAWTCLATAQSSQSHLSSAPPPDPLKTATKPLTGNLPRQPRTSPRLRCRPRSYNEYERGTQPPGAAKNCSQQ